MANIYVDTDMILYTACASCEQEVDWGDDYTTVLTNKRDSLNYFSNHFKEYLSSALNHYKVVTDKEFKLDNVYMCMSDGKNWRKSVLPSYKANRTKRKPCGYKWLKKQIQGKYHCLMADWLEADDIIGINVKHNDIILSGDKDMNTLNAYFYDFLHDKFVYNTKEKADHFWLLQTLTGDTADGYVGLKGVGKVSAEKILSSSCDWETVLNAYLSKGYSREFCMIQSRIARILRRKEYFNKGSKSYIKLWENKLLELGKNEAKILE